LPTPVPVAEGRIFSTRREDLKRCPKSEIVNLWASGRAMPGYWPRTRLRSRLPVVTLENPRKVTGWLTRSDLLSAHGQRLEDASHSNRHIKI